MSNVEWRMLNEGESAIQHSTFLIQHSTLPSVLLRRSADTCSHPSYPFHSALPGGWVTNKPGG